LREGAERVAGRHLDIGSKIVAPEVIIGVTFDEVIPAILVIHETLLKSGPLVGGDDLR
jgi:hypothetical protein